MVLLKKLFSWFHYFWMIVGEAHPKCTFKGTRNPIIITLLFLRLTWNWINYKNSKRWKKKPETCLTIQDNRMVGLDGQIVLSIGNCGVAHLMSGLAGQLILQLLTEPCNYNLKGREKTVWDGVRQNTYRGGCRVEKMELGNTKKRVVERHCESEIMNLIPVLSIPTIFAQPMQQCIVL